MSALDRIPAELRARPQWVVWRLEERDQKSTKVPYRADGSGRASSTDPATWATFEAAVAGSEALAADGIGFVFTRDDPFVGVDLDDGLSKADRGAIMLALDSYTETSVGGGGQHVILKASLNGFDRRRRGPFEVYDAGRYFVVTGEHVRGTPTTVEARQAELEQVLAQFLPRPSNPPAPQPSSPVDLDDQELLERAFAARNGADFRALWEGAWEDHYPSQSEADYALCSSLAFWTGRDSARIESLFRSSGLYRGEGPGEAKSAGYLGRTIERAISATSDVYEPSARNVGGTSRQAARPRTDLAAVLTAVRRYMDVDDNEDTFIVCALATAVSKALPDEEPLWLFLIGPPGGGKTEAIRLLDPVADQRVDELTRAGLLSWSPGKKARRVGLLTRIPAVALVTISDFSTVATMGDREARARMYGMLRVVYDGHVYRGIGGEPAAEGDELEWSGHLTLVAGATPAIDAHTSVEAALGERWLTVRLPESSAERARQRARFVIERAAVPPLRAEAQAKANELILAARKRIPARLSKTDEDRLVDAAALVATARTGVPFEGQGRSRVAVGLPVPEEPTRLIGQLNRLARCLIALGVDADAACTTAVVVALDSVPLARMRALEAVASAGEVGATVSSVHRGLGRGNRWTALWELEALEAIGLIEVEGPPRDEDASATRLYRLIDAWRGVYENVARPHIFPLKEEDSYGGALRIRTPSSAHTEPQGEAS